jgi:predicted dehydrogenase
MAINYPLKKLRLGFVGSGFIGHFHLQAMIGVRNVEINGVYSPTAAHREKLARAVIDAELGQGVTYDSLESLLQAPDVDAIWILAPNYTRLEVMGTINRMVKSGDSGVMAVACEKPLARTLAEAREMLRLAEDANLNHGYLENQVFCTPVLRGKEIIWRRAAATTGRPYLARAAEEHSGPHEPWFWRGDLQGGGVLSDMMCHSVEVARFMLTEPGRSRDSLRLKTVNGTVASLKWSRPDYVKRLKDMMGDEVDYAKRPAEDFARALLTLEDQDGTELVIESTTSWAYVGPGLRIQLELLGPEYAMEFSSLNTGLKIFMSREVRGHQGQDLVEKQNAEQGLMPVLDDEPSVYGYVDENRHMVECFRKGETPIETFHDGVAVMEILMALYRSSELGEVVKMPCPELENYIPPVARTGS